MSSPKVKPQNHNNNILPIIACKEIIKEWEKRREKTRHKREKITRLYANQTERVPVLHSMHNSFINVRLIYGKREQTISLLENKREEEVHMFRVKWIEYWVDYNWKTDICSWLLSRKSSPEKYFMETRIRIRTKIPDYRQVTSDLIL